MQYKFIVGLDKKVYYKMIKDYLYIHYEAEQTKNDKIIYVGFMQNKKYLGSATILIKNYCFYIYNLIMLTTDNEIRKLFLKSIYNLAEKERILKIINVSLTPKIVNLTKKGYTEKYLLPLKINNYPLGSHYSKIFSSDNNDFFSISNKLTKKLIKQLKETINIWNLNVSIEDILQNYQHKCTIYVDKINLVYYLNHLQSQNISLLAEDTIRELIHHYGEEMITGFAIMVYPSNKQISYCLELYCINAFEDLNSEDYLISIIINDCLKKKYQNIIFNKQIKNTNTIYEIKEETILHKIKYYIFNKKKRRC